MSWPVQSSGHGLSAVAPLVLECKCWAPETVDLCKLQSTLSLNMFLNYLVIQSSETLRWQRSKFFRLFPTILFPNNFEAKILTYCFILLLCLKASHWVYDPAMTLWQTAPPPPSFSAQSENKEGPIIGNNEMLITCHSPNASLAWKSVCQEQ